MLEERHLAFNAPATDPYRELRLIRMAYRLLVATNQLDDAADLLLAQQVLNVLQYGTRHARCDETRTETPPPVVEGYEVVNTLLGPIYLPTEQVKPESYTAMERAHQLGYQVVQSGPGLTPEAHAALMPGLRQAARVKYEQVWKGKLDDKKSDGCYTAMDLFWLDPLIKRYFATTRGCEQVPGEGPMFDDTFPEGKPATDPMHELRLLRMAYRLLIATNQQDAAADLLIAQQVLNVLQYGTRHAPRDETRTEPPPPVVEGYEVVNVPDYAPIYFPAGSADTPKSAGFTTIPERVAALGFSLTDDARSRHLPCLEKRAMAAHVRLCGVEPIHQPGDANWYPPSLAKWLDAIIMEYLARVFRGETPAPEKGM